jgi:hypothetical protein
MSLCPSAKSQPTAKGCKNEIVESCRIMSCHVTSRHVTSRHVTCTISACSLESLYHSRIWLSNWRCTFRNLLPRGCHVHTQWAHPHSTCVDPHHTRAIAGNVKKRTSSHKKQESEGTLQSTSSVRVKIPCKNSSQGAHRSRSIVWSLSTRCLAWVAASSSSSHA